MQKLYVHFIILFVLCLTSCFEKQVPDIESAKETKPYFKGTRKINLIVDDSYDLSTTEAHSISDSISMSGKDNNIYVPEEFESAAFFLDRNSGEILAVVRTDTVSEKVHVNAESVADALLDLVPAYHALTLEQKDKFEGEVMAIKPYKDFVLTVDALLKNKQPIYSIDPVFIGQLYEINSYLLEKYLGNPSLEGARAPDLKGAKNAGLGDDDFANWLTRENGASIRNQVSSYVYAEFIPLSGGGSFSTILDPKQPTTALSSMVKQDDCYTVILNQSHKTVYSKNWLAVAEKTAGLFLNIIFGKMGQQSRNDCIGSIAGVIVGDLTTTMMGLPNSSLKDVLIKVGETARNLIITGVTGEACVTYATNTKVIAAAVAAQFNVFSKFVTYASTAYSVVELTPYLIAVGMVYGVDEVDLSEVIQLHKYKLIEACVEVVKEGTLEEEYSAGEKIHPSVKLITKSQYAEWDKAGFTVNWITEDGNGSVSLAGLKINESKTDVEGKAIVEWNLPDDKSGNVTLIAEIKDEEDHHINGSPLKFNITLMDSIEFYRRAVIGNWTFEYDYLGYDDGVTQIDKMVFYEDGTGKRVSGLAICYPRYGCTEDKFTDHTDKWGTDPLYDLVWYITYDNFRKRYIFNSYDKRWMQNIAVELNPSMEGLLHVKYNSWSTYNINAIKDK